MANKSIGALWSRKARNGADYLAGQIVVGGVACEFVCFLNLSKTESKHPDYRIFMRESPDEQIEENMQPMRSGEMHNQFPE